MASNRNSKNDIHLINESSDKNTYHENLIDNGDKDRLGFQEKHDSVHTKGQMQPKEGVESKNDDIRKDTKNQHPQKPPLQLQQKQRSNLKISDQGLPVELQQPSFKPPVSCPYNNNQSSSQPLSSQLQPGPERHTYYSNVSHFHPSQLFLGPDGAIFAMIQPPTKNRSTVKEEQQLPSIHAKTATNSIPPESTTYSIRPLHHPDHYTTAAVISEPYSLVPVSSTETTSVASAATRTNAAFMMDSTTLTGSQLLSDNNRSIKRVKYTANDTNMNGQDDAVATATVSSASAPTELSSSQGMLTQQQPMVLSPSASLLSTMTHPNHTSGLQPNVQGSTSHSPLFVSLYCAAIDERNLSQYQSLCRQQMEFFSTSLQDASASAQGRNKSLQVGQVGIRCKHCKHLQPMKARKTGSVYFPNKLVGIYQTAQKLTWVHLLRHCPCIPETIRKRLLFLKDQKSSDGGGKAYWADSAQALGVVQTSLGLAFATMTPPSTTTKAGGTEPTAVVTSQDNTISITTSMTLV